MILFKIIALLFYVSQMQTYALSHLPSSKSLSKQPNNHDIPKECSLCHHNFTIILGTGRSGSSSLLAMLNLLPNYDLSGEHNGQLFKFKDIYDDMLRVKYMKSYAWLHKDQDLHKYLCYIQNWFYHESGQKISWIKDDVHGFKEIVSSVNVYIQLIKHYCIAALITIYHNSL